MMVQILDMERMLRGYGPCRAVVSDLEALSPNPRTANQNNFSPNPEPPANCGAGLDTGSDSWRGEGSSACAWL